jgi:hypothetical protein
LAPVSQDAVKNSSSGISEIDEYAIPISKCIALKTSVDTRPHNLITASLQKGLRFVYRQKEMVGEGTGFGVPVILCSDETYFSGSSRLYLCRQRDSITVRKEFVMDKIQRKELGGIRLENQKLRAAWKSMDRLYQKHRHLQIFATALGGKLGVHFSFLKIEPIGKVILTYSAIKNRLNIGVDLNLTMRKKLRKVFLLNEQGTAFFRNYSDSTGIQLADNQIGAWQRVEAESACISDMQRRVGFSLQKKKDSILHVGRELLQGSADWIGLDYELSNWNGTFEYGIEFLEV